MKSLKLVFLIWLFCQMLICESTAQQVSAGTVSIGLQFNYQQTRDRYSKQLSYHFDSELSADYYLINNLGLGGLAGVGLTNGIVDFHFGPYAKLFIIKGLFAQAGYNIYSGTQSYQTIPIRLGYGRLFNSGFSIEPTITYEKSLNKDIHSQLAFGIGARYYFNRKI